MTRLPDPRFREALRVMRDHPERVITVCACGMEIKDGERCDHGNK